MDIDYKQKYEDLVLKVRVLTEDYKRRLNSATKMVEELEKEPEHPTTESAIHRLKSKSVSYRNTLADLFKLLS